jgi:hypothetical protein
MLRFQWFEQAFVIGRSNSTETACGELLDGIPSQARAVS